MLSLRVSRDKRGYDHIYLVLEARRRTGRPDDRAESRLLYCGRWPSPCRVGQRPFDDGTRHQLEQTYPDIAFDWPALLKTLQAALGGPRMPVSAAPPPASRSRRPGAGGPPPGSARPSAGGRGRPLPSAGPQQPGREPIEPAEIEPGEAEYIPGEVVLVTAEFEEPDPALADTEFEPVCEADRQFAASIDFELVTDEIVHIPVPEAASTQPAAPRGGHVFAQPGEPAGFAPDAADEGDDEVDGPDAEQPHGGPSAAPGQGSAPGGVAHAHRRRRRRGGRGRGH